MPEKKWITFSRKPKGYLPHQIRIKFKHPKFLDDAKVKNIQTINS